MRAVASPSILPSILSSSFVDIKENLSLMASSGVECLHLDVMDGNFVPPITFGQSFVAQVSRLWKGLLDVHLMVEKPLDFAERLAVMLDESALKRTWISFHSEITHFPVRTARSIRKLGYARVGIAFNPSTSVDFLKYLHEFFDFALVMLVEPGFGGQRMMSSVLEKVSFLRRFMEVEVDGGVNSETIEDVVKSGATLIVSGSYLFPEGRFSESRWKALTKKL